MKTDRAPFLLAGTLAAALSLFVGCSNEPDKGEVVVVKGAELVFVPGGTFTLGDTSIKNATKATVKSFLIDKREVTNGEYRKFAETFHLPFPVPRAYDSLPVINVPWEAADAFAAWRGCRLPTEAEWEYAATGGEDRTYPWGNDWDAALANGNDDADPMAGPDGSKDGFARIAPVGLFPRGASPVGALDMAGNVWEWVADWYAPLPDSEVTNYVGPMDGERKVIRGGSFSVNSINLRTFHRAFLPPQSTRDDIGFRCASDWPVPESLVPGAEDTSGGN